jgi:hypothetical protein
MVCKQKHDETDFLSKTVIWLQESSWVECRKPKMSPWSIWIWWMRRLGSSRYKQPRCAAVANFLRSLSVLAIANYLKNLEAANFLQYFVNIYSNLVNMSPPATYETIALRMKRTLSYTPQESTEKDFTKESSSREAWFLIHYRKKLFSLFGRPGFLPSSREAWFLIQLSGV